MLYNDSIKSLSDLEISIHKKIWDLTEVDSISRSLRDLNIKTYTFIDSYPTKIDSHYKVRFGQVAAEQLPTIFNYRIDITSGQVEKAVDWFGFK